MRTISKVIGDKMKDIDEYKNYLEQFKFNITLTFIKSRDEQLSDIANFIFTYAKKLNLNINVDFYSARKLNLCLYYKNVPLWVAAVALEQLLYSKKWIPKKIKEYFGMFYLLSYMHKTHDKVKLINLLPDNIDKKTAEDSLLKIPFLYGK